MKTPFDYIPDPDDADEETNERLGNRLVCRECQRTIERQFCLSMEETVAAHICDDEPMDVWYDFNDPRTVLEQREAYRAKPAHTRCQHFKIGDCLIGWPEDCQVCPFA